MLENNFGPVFLTVLNPRPHSGKDWQFSAHVFSNVLVDLYLEANLCPALQEEMAHYLDREYLKVKYSSHAKFSKNNISSFQILSCH